MEKLCSIVCVLLGLVLFLMGSTELCIYPAPLLRLLCEALFGATNFLPGRIQMIFNTWSHHWLPRS